MQTDMLTKAKKLQLSQKSLFYFSLFGIIVIYAIGMDTDIMEYDAALYAEIAREMATTNNYWELYYRGEDWLDKPHLTFWLIALSFEIFGVNNFAYKLPSIVMFLVGLRYVWLLAIYEYKGEHGEQIAALAVLILALSQHIISSNNDVRTDALLLGFIVMAAYHCRRLIDSKQLSYMLVHILGGAIALAAALMTKGIFILLIPAGGVIAHAFYKRKPFIIFNIRWFVLAALCLLLISPMLIAYYFQFDAQPHKQVNMQDWGTVSNLSAIKFYFWDSQVGRVVDTGLVRGTGTYWFYLTTILWAFMPWGVLWYVFLCTQARRIFLRQDAAVFYLGCSLPLFLIYSFASFQLPHYINILLPFFSIGIAHFLVTLNNPKLGKVLAVIQAGQIILLLIFMGYIFIAFNPRLELAMVDTSLLWMLGLIVIFILYSYKNQWKMQIVFAPAMAMIMLNYAANRIILPQLLEYQCGSQIAHHINNNQLTDAPLYTYGIKPSRTAVDFYMNSIVPILQPTDKDVEERFYLITSEQGLQDLKNNGYKTEVLLIKPDYPISRISPKFLNHKTREDTILHCYLVLASSK